MILFLCGCSCRLWLLPACPCWASPSTPTSRENSSWWAWQGLLGRKSQPWTKIRARNPIPIQHSWRRENLSLWIERSQWAAVTTGHFMWGTNLPLNYLILFENGEEKNHSFLWNGIVKDGKVLIQPPNAWLEPGLLLPSGWQGWGGLPWRFSHAVECCGSWGRLGFSFSKKGTLFHLHLQVGTLL